LVQSGRINTTFGYARIGDMMSGDDSDVPAGSLLVASPVLMDPNFHKTVVLMLQCDADGAVGVVLNRPSEEPVESHLPEWVRHLEDPPVVFVGGPVDRAVAIGVVRSDRPSEPTAVNGVGMVDLASDPAAATPGPVRVFSGYAGWGPGQAEAEVAEGAWFVLEARAEDVFTSTPAELWSAVLRRQGGRLAMWATFPLDPSMN
jgi:putative transcriptional regulator